MDARADVRSPVPTQAKERLSAVAIRSRLDGALTQSRPTVNVLAGAVALRYAAADDSALAPWLHYPLVVAGAFGLFAGLQALGLSLVLSTYVPIIATALEVTLLEIRFPYRLDWRPNGGEIRTDGRTAGPSSWHRAHRWRASG